MSGMCLAFTGHSKSAYKWIQQCQILYFSKNIIKTTNVYSAMQYCVSIPEGNKHLAKIIDSKFEDVVNTNYLDTHTRSNKTIKSIDEVTNDVYDEEKTDRFTSNRFRENILSERLEYYKDPKNSLLQIYEIVCEELNDQTLFTSTCNQDPKSQQWEYTYSIKWPETKSFKVVNKRKTTASTMAAFKCLEWLEINKKLKNGKPILYNKEQIQDMQSRPHELNVDPKILESMENLIKTYEMDIDISRKDDYLVYSCNVHARIPNFEAFGIPAYNVTNVRFRNQTLQGRLAERQMQYTDLPIFKFRDKILSMIEENRVLLIEGDTGCGKSTQVPQFILNSYARNGNAVDCNILVSQPRKISAIALADHVARARGEIVGDVVGYQVRMENMTPQEYGRILYCSTGILLKKLECVPNLKGCSHVILDEAHERSIDTDILIILLKRALDLNPDLKLVIMSATINTHLFQEYFNCPSVTVPGRLYPVEMNFLEDIDSLPGFKQYEPYLYRINDQRPEISVDFSKLMQTIRWIAENKPHGAILCFLPGWQEIMIVQKMFEDEPLTSQNQLILPIHSKETHDAQRRIFQEVPDDTRKIILATNIAETSITVPDVCYVVDSAICKTVEWDDNKDIMCVNNKWISQANIKQRKGRAGRVRPGFSYHLISRKEYDKLMEYPLADILTHSLENIILNCKSYTNEKVEDFLNGLMEPPAPSRVQKGVKYLINIGVLDKEENLTALGKRMTIFTMHPKFSKALVYSTIFNCVHPVLTIASIFSNEDSGFSNVLSQKAKNRENKALYHPSSDHIAMSWIYNTWDIRYKERPRLGTKFCEQINLRPRRIQILSALRNLYLRDMVLCRLLNNIQRNADYNAPVNKYADNDELVKAILYSSSQQLIEYKNVGFKNGILRKGIDELQIGKFKALITSDSVNYKRKVWPSPYLTYFRSEHNSAYHRTMIRETSIISPLTVLLFNQREIERHEEGDKTEIKIKINEYHTVNFSCDKRTADVLLKFKDIMWSTVQYSLEKQGIEYDNFESRLRSGFKNNLLETLVAALGDAESKCVQDKVVDNNENSNNNDEEKDNLH